MTRALAFALLLSPALEAQIFADFTTSLGSFTCELNHTASPRTVANFVGLADGSRAWLDLRDGAVRQGDPFFDGTTVHRVIGSTLLQAGTRTGAGDEGPGWVFRDEFANGLTHNAPYVISMANSGPNSNGSQFFITSAALPALNGLHTVFGKVVTGQAVVDAITRVPAANQSPVTPVTIQTVRIRRSGASAEAFDVTAQNLPTVEPAAGPLRVGKNIRTALAYSGDRSGGAWTRAWRSTDLARWTPVTDRYVGRGSTIDAEWTLDQADAPRAFFRLSVTKVPGALGPDHFRNRTIELDFTPTDRWTYSLGPDGKTGTLTITPYAPSELPPVTMATTVVSEKTGPYSIEVVFNTPEAPFRAEVPGYIRLNGRLAGESGGFVTGSQTIDSGTEFGWSGFDAGTLKLSQ